MLGAQARAAELQAAKSAAMRQRAHREAEELFSPPDSAPVSLTDFTRTSLLNKNKGAKAFRPLIDSDFDRPTSQIDLSSSTSERSPPMESLRASSVTEIAPVAPRAMLNTAGCTSSKTTPSRANTTSFKPQVKVVGASTNTPDIFDNASLHSIYTPTYMRNSSLVAASPYTSSMQHLVGQVFGPDDLSPSKQEIKFEEMRQHHTTLQTIQTPIQRMQSILPAGARAFTSQQDYLYDTPLQHPDVYSQTAFEQSSHNQRPFLHYSEPSMSIAGCDPAYAQVERTRMFADDLLHHQHRLQQQNRNQGQTRAPHLNLEHERPYDRSSKMQSFVAAQQAMAKKGKTVLHNPDLHRSPVHVRPVTPKSYSSAVIEHSPTPATQHTILHQSNAISEVPDQRKSIGLEDKEAILHNMSKSEGQQRNSDQDSSISHQGLVSSSAAQNSSDGFSLFDSELMSEDWCTLRPITLAEREKMSRKIRRVFVTEPSYLYMHTVAARTITGSDRQERSQTRNAEKSSRILAMEQIVDEYQKRPGNPSDYGIIGKPVARERSDLGSRGGLKAVARVMAALHDAADDRKKGLERNQYTPPPRHAIDGNAVFSAAGSSFFDDLGFVPNTA